MALVYNELDASQVVTQVCSPDASGVDIYGGYCNIDGTVTPDIDKLNHDGKILTISGVKFNLRDDAKYITGIIDIREVEFVTNFLEVGRLVRYGVSAVWYWAAILEITPVTGGYAMTAVALTYDDGWIDNQRLENMVYVGGYSNFQNMSCLDKFNSATGFGVGSRRIVKLLNGEYDDCPSMDMSPGGVSIQGLDNNRNPGKCDIVKSHCSTPTIYIGPKATIATTPVDRVIKLGHYAALDGVKIVVNNATQAAIVNPASDGRNISANNLYVKDYSTQSYPIFTRHTNVGTSIYETQSSGSAFSFDRLSADDLCVIAPRGLSINAGDFITIGNLLAVTIPSDSTCYAFGLPSNLAGLQCGNIIAVSLSRPDLSRLFYSRGTSLTTITANTMLIDGYGAFTPAGRYAGPVLVNILAVRESFVDQLQPEIKYNELIVIPDSEKIFLDKYNRDFTVIHPRLLRAGVGINKMPESIIRLGDKY